jgi:ketosteroid isomerase-like protein
VARVRAEHPNAALVRGLFEAFAARDGLAVAAALADDVVWRLGGSSPMAGEYRGRRAVVRFLGSTTALTDGTYRSELLYALADDEHAVAVYRATGKRGEDSIDIVQVLLCEVRDGHLVDVTAVPTDQAAFEAFWR